MPGNVTYQTPGDRVRFRTGDLQQYRGYPAENLAPLARDAFDRGDLGTAQALSRRFLDKAMPPPNTAPTRGNALAALSLGKRHFDIGQARRDRDLRNASTAFLHLAWRGGCVRTPEDVQTLAYALTVQRRLDKASHILQRTLEPAPQRPDGWAHYPNDGVLRAEMGNVALFMALQCADEALFNQGRALARSLYQRAAQEPPPYQTRPIRLSHYRALDQNVLVLNATYHGPTYGLASHKLLELRPGTVTPIKDAVLAGLRKNAAYQAPIFPQAPFAGPFLLGTVASLGNPNGYWQQGGPSTTIQFRPENREAIRRIDDRSPVPPVRTVLPLAPAERLVSAPLPRASSGHGSSAQMDRTSGARGNAGRVPPPPPPPPPGRGLYR